MGVIRAAFALTVLAASPALAEDAGYFECRGTLPDWSLSLTGDSARLQMDDRDMAMAVDVVSRADGRDMPRAAALLAGADDDYDTAIILLDAAECTSGDRTDPVRGHLLTQIGNRAVLLTGCCRPAR